MNTYIWKINSLECIKPDNNIVYKIHWEVTATDNKNTVSLNDVCTIDLDQSNPLIDYSKLTELEVLKWLEKSIGIDKMQEMQKQMDFQLIALNSKIINIETEVTPLPWID